jgi:WD40 repeat protein
VAISSDSRWLVTGSKDNNARLWTLKMDELLGNARLAAGRELTAKEREMFLLPPQKTPRTENP